ncbi:helix-turn-helix domain-containing protein [Rhizobium ruizarguesonis]|uniref:helix-turn-helix domain-containing protein n=1 Tax=Rhizobium ruizarguesonis TaxID=2081791 RepID=UPI00102FB308|nr:helix-turn-helix domain-containing protein [Rhizobium ruizarguesonis]TAW60511.1 helix-turn-helix domain-containing protein [Rhizobium ruizarguesonis]TAX01304.1 helix-turn-helix domain-containing protein [Rhizobium ruizarguesonis]TAX02981.1 helix-turn-helix domain-containing protein [Rhizobium ruizarguesonis]
MVDVVQKVDGAPDVAAKWGYEVAERGFTQVPHYLMFLNQFVDEGHRLTPVELLLLIQLVSVWWRKEEQPYPSMATLAVRCGVSERQVQRSVARLEKLNLLKRVKRRTSGIISSNAYDLTPLVEFLVKVSEIYPNAFPRQIARGKLKLPKDSLSPVEGT